MKYILSILAWTTGAVTMVVMVPLTTLIFSMLDFHKISIVARISFRIMTAAFWVRVRVEGIEKVEPNPSVLYMANHASFFDFLILAAYLPGDKHGVQAIEHFSWPVWGTLLRKAGLVAIDRSNPRASMKSINQAADYLKAGDCVLILPEGTRTKDGRMIPFKKLPFKLAKKGGRAIVPVGLVGTFNLKRKASWLLRPGRVEMRFGDPIPAEEIAEKELTEIMEITRARIAELVGEKTEEQVRDAS